VNKHTFVIIGCGRIAQRHAEHIQNYGHLVAVCDIKRERADDLAKRYNCRAYYDLGELLTNEPDIEVVSICTPNYLHAPQTIQSLEVGKHVVCEKPMALSTRDCENMIFAAEKYHRRLFIVKQNRYNPPIQELKQAIENDKLGKILSVELNCFWNRNEAYYQDSDWKGILQKDGGTLFTQFSHFIDLILWLVGDITDVKVFRGNFLHKGLIEFEDSGVVALKFYNGALGSIHYTVNSYRKNMEGSITIFGEKGSVKIGGQYLNALEYDEIEGFHFSHTEVVNKANDYGFYQGSMSNHDKVYENVINVLDGQETIATNSIEGMKVVRVIEKIYSESKLENLSE